MSVAATAAQSSNSVLNSYLQQQAQNANAATASANNSGTTSGSSSATSATGIGANFNTFLKILTTQLTHQDPTAATDTNQFTQELVQFAGVEQQINTNGSLTQLVNMQKGTKGLSAALGYIGGYVEAPANGQISLQNGKANFAYNLPSAVKSAIFNVTDSTGKTVTTLSGATTAGLQRVSWDGTDSNGNQLPDGAYKIQLAATQVDGTPLTVTDIRALGLVTSVQSNSDGTTSLSFGNGMSVLDSTVDAVYASSSLPKASA